MDKKKCIPSGNYRSYGDSAFSTDVINSKDYNSIISFDSSQGILKVQSGITIDEVLTIIVPMGWFLAVTPGTKFATIGGAIASDVHGKNHHIDGCFSTCLINFDLMLPDGKVRNVEKKDRLFKATCGGMGLTGIIINASIKLKKIKSSYINQLSIKTRNLKETFDVFESYANSSYSVAWFDGFSKLDKLGKCIIEIGDFSDDGILDYKKEINSSIPFKYLSYLLSTYHIKLFNYLYYRLASSNPKVSKVPLSKFFYPLDKFSNWNEIYGRGGFLQYQFILPKEKSYEGIQEIFRIIHNNKTYPYLSVLKLYGEENENYLSFPMEGYSLAMDFKANNKTLLMFNELDKIVCDYGGRIYLTKDARLSEKNFKSSYPKVDKFIEVRNEHDPYKKFNSLQSQRLGI